MSQKRISPSAKQFLWVYNRQEMSVGDEFELRDIMEDAGFFTIVLDDDRTVFINLDYWDQVQPNHKEQGFKGLVGVVSGLKRLGWYPHTADIQFNPKKWAKKHELELQWLLNWVESRVSPEAAAAISPFKE